MRQYKVMKICSLSMVLVVVLLLAGCRSEANNVLDSVIEADAPKELVKKYVDDNTYIDIDVDALVRGIITPDSRISGSEEDLARMKAAVYRFYRHVSVKEGYYVCDIKGGSEINVSQEVFSALLGNLNDMNRMIREAKDRGEKIDIPVPDEDYLNTLLR